VTREDVSCLCLVSAFSTLTRVERRRTPLLADLDNDGYGSDDPLPWPAGADVRGRRSRSSSPAAVKTRPKEQNRD
jgi:hypothetical protein